MISVGLLITGNEVLSAKTKDTNGPFMGMHLRKIGASVRASLMCADQKTDLIDCLNYLSERCDVILMTGGLGPTSDDLTAEVIADFFSVPLEFREEAWNACVEFFKKAGRDQIPKSNKKQAMLPKNAKILFNDLGTACGFNVQGNKNGKTIQTFSLPGVPYEMEAMFLEQVLPLLVTNTGFPPVTKTWQVFNLGESTMQGMINSLEQEIQTKFKQSAISYQAHSLYVTYTISLFAKDKNEYESAKKEMEENFSKTVCEKFSNNIIYSEDKKLTQYIIEKLNHNKMSLGILDANSSGFLSKEFSVNDLDSLFYKGCLSLYSENIFTNILKVDLDYKNNLKNPTDEFIKNICFKSVQLLNADFLLSEFGEVFDKTKEKNIENPGFFLCLTINKKNQNNLKLFSNNLNFFGWQKIDSNSSEQFEIFKYFIKTNKRHTREVQLNRASIYLLCSLASIL